MKTIGGIAKLLLIVLLLAVALHYLFPRVHAAETDRYAGQWFVYGSSAEDKLEMRYVLLTDGARIYIRYWRTDPGNGDPTSLVIGQFKARCGADGVAPATVTLQRLTQYDPATQLPLSDTGLDEKGVPATVDPTKPLGRIVAIVCAAHAYALRSGIH